MTSIGKSREIFSSVQVRRGRGRWYPSLPEGVRVYAIGDIHGRLDLLNEFVAQNDEDLAENRNVRPIYVFLAIISIGDRGRAERSID
jgi:serine/threonine protein phosphatase 1